MIDQYNEDHTGWARFSDDKTMRYRLARSMTGEPVSTIPRAQIAVFVMLNPSTADAWVLDPTVRRCSSFAHVWDASAVEVVNLFAYRATDPRELYKRAHGFRGDVAESDDEILMACTGAFIVVAAWGTHGALDRRGDLVRGMITSRGIQLHRLGRNRDGSPKHPLYIKAGTQPTRWTT